MRILLAIFGLALNNFVIGSNTSCCQNLTKRAPTERYISQHGEPKNISVYWDSELTRATGSLLTAILRHVHRYQYVELRQSPAQRSNETTCHLNGILKEVKLELSTSQTTSDPVVALDINLQVHLAKHLQNEERWAKVTEWNFYNDAKINLTDYGFSYNNISGKSSLDVFLIEPLESNARAMVKNLTSQTNGSLLQLNVKELNMVDFDHMLQTQKQSFLFFGYNMYADNPNIKIIQSPIGKINANIAMHVTDKCLVEELAREIDTIAKNYKLSATHLKELLELGLNTNNTEEAACRWISNHSTYSDSLLDKYDARGYYTIRTIYCGDPEQKSLFKSLHTNLGNAIYAKYNSTAVIFTNYDADNCTDTNYYMEDILKNNIITPSTIGVILEGVRNVTEYNVVKALDGLGVPVLIYNMADVDVEESTSVWLTSGRTMHIVLALHQFFTTNKVKRIDVISDKSLIAERYITELSRLSGFEMYIHPIESNIDLEAKTIKNLIKGLKPNSTIFVNTNYVDAVTILLAAEALNQTEKQNYTWIVRDWKPNEKTKNIGHFTISNTFSDVKNTSMLASWTEPKDNWPAQAAALTDAYLILLHGFMEVINKFPQARYDTQSKEVIKLFETSLNDPKGIEGVSQNLKFKGHSLEETTVYLDEWHGNQRKRISSWKTNTTTSGKSLHLSSYGIHMTLALFCLIQNYGF